MSKPGDISAEKVGLEPVHWDKDFVGGADGFCPIGASPNEESSFAFGVEMLGCVFAAWQIFREYISSIDYGSFSPDIRHGTSMKIMKIRAAFLPHHFLIEHLLGQIPSLLVSDLRNWWIRFVFH